MAKKELAPTYNKKAHKRALKKQRKLAAAMLRAEAAKLEAAAAAAAAAADESSGSDSDSGGEGSSSGDEARAGAAAAVSTVPAVSAARVASITDAARRDGLSFGYLVSLIPAEFYVPLDAADSELSRKMSKYHKHTHKSRAMPHEKADKKAESRQRKRAKYDDEANPSTADVMRQRAKAKPMVQPQSRAAQAAAQAAAAAAAATAVAAAGKTTSIDALRAKLQQRIASLRGSRGGDSSQRERTKGKGRASKGAKKKKAAAAAAAAAEAPAAADATRVLDETARRAAKADMRIAFGNIHFDGKASSGKASDGTGSSPTKRKGKKPLPQLLKEAEAKKRRLEELKKTPEGQKLVTEGAWDKLMMKATGAKTRDDPKLLKRAIKRKQTSKRKSQEAWAERKEIEKRAGMKKQDRRNANIEKQRDKKRNFKGGIANLPQNASRPGFEGGGGLLG